MTVVRGWLFIWAMVFAWVVGSPGPAAAASEGPTVTLVVPQSPDPVMAEVLVRVEGELRAAGFDVSVMRQAPEESPKDALANAARELSPIALVGVFGTSQTGIDLWVLDRIKQRTVRRAIRNADLGSRNSEVLAVRTAEQLSASLNELDIGPAPPPTPPESKPAPVPPAAARQVASPPVTPEKRGTVGLEVGPAVVFSFEGIGPAILPFARLSISPLPALDLRLSGAGLGTRPQITSELGTARFAQSFFILDATYGLQASTRLRAYAALGGGAYHARVFGSSATELPSKDSSAWAVALEAGAGFSYRLARSIELVTELDALLLSPYAVVRFADQERAKTGRPAVLLATAVRGWL